MTIAKRNLVPLCVLALAWPFPAGAETSFALCRTLFQQGRYDQAVAPCTRAAGQGSLDAQKWLGLIYTRGQGVAQDYAAALKWKKMAALQGDAGAQFSYGRMLEQGLGTRPDPAEALTWYRKAAAQGNVDAWYSIGSLYYRGMGVEKDPVVALAWYQLAADQGMYLAREAVDKLSAELSADRQTAAAELAGQLRKKPGRKE